MNDTHEKTYRKIPEPLQWIVISYYFLLFKITLKSLY